MEFLRYVKDGQVVEVAALMIVAWKRLCDLAMTARSMLTRSEVRVSRDRKTAMLQLFDIFESAGDDLESYVKRPKLFVCILCCLCVCVAKWLLRCLSMITLFYALRMCQSPFSMVYICLLLKVGYLPYVLFWVIGFQKKSHHCSQIFASAKRNTCEARRN